MIFTLHTHKHAHRPTRVSHFYRQDSKTTASIAHAMILLIIQHRLKKLKSTV